MTNEICGVDYAAVSNGSGCLGELVTRFTPWAKKMASAPPTHLCLIFFSQHQRTEFRGI